MWRLKPNPLHKCGESKPSLVPVTRMQCSNQVHRVYRSLPAHPRRPHQPKKLLSASTRTGFSLDKTHFWVCYNTEQWSNPKQPKTIPSLCGMPKGVLTVMALRFVHVCDFLRLVASLQVWPQWWRKRCRCSRSRGGDFPTFCVDSPPSYNPWDCLALSGLIFQQEHWLSKDKAEITPAYPTSFSSLSQNIYMLVTVFSH